MPTLPFYVIPRYNGACVELFLPDAPANPGHIVCYGHVGQHSEASMEYYAKTRRPTPSLRAKLHSLLNEYRQKLEPSEHLEIVRRDTKKFQETRWSNFAKTDRLPEDIDGRNSERAQWAEKALRVFAKITGLSWKVEKTEAVGDLLANIRHFCDRHKIDYDAALRMAATNYEAETGKGPY